MTTDDPFATILARLAHVTPTAHDRRIIDFDRLPGSSRRPVGDEDPYGKEADRESARVYGA